MLRLLSGLGVKIQTTDINCANKLSVLHSSPVMIYSMLRLLFFLTPFCSNFWLRPSFKENYADSVRDGWTGLMSDDGGGGGGGGTGAFGGVSVKHEQVIILKYFLIKQFWIVDTACVAVGLRLFLNCDPFDLCYGPLWITCYCENKHYLHREHAHILFRVLWFMVIGKACSSLQLPHGLQLSHTLWIWL